jgi:predicted peptidase
MKQHAYTFSSAQHAGVALPYLLFVPRAYGVNPHQQWPLILFLHGKGERGDDLALVRRHGIPKVVEEQEDFPLFAISPQCPLETDWTPHHATLMALVDDLLARYAIDPTCVYVTGLSMGGRGTWLLAVEYPERFAALAPICGRMPPEPGFVDTLPVLKSKPIWVFHGAKDPVVPIAHAETMVHILRAHGSAIRFTVYRDAAHDAWTATYNNPHLYTWFASHALPDKRPGIPLPG